MNTTKLIDTIKESASVKEVCIKSGFGRKKIVNIINKYNVDISHFDRNGSKKRKKYTIIEKACKICGTLFFTKHCHPKEKTFCSNKCSALGRDMHPIQKHNIANNIIPKHNSYYRDLCFKTFENKCQICFFEKCIEVHHIDGDRKNNIKENLIPLCPNHHMMVHQKKYNYEIQSQIDIIMNNIFGYSYNKISPQKIFRGHKIDGVCRKSKIPTKEELEKIIWSIPSTYIAKKYNVSDSTIVKWCKKLNIKKPARGYWKKNKSNND